MDEEETKENRRSQDLDYIMLNRTLKGQLGAQKAEQVFDKTYLDYTISLRQEIDTKTQMMLKHDKEFYIYEESQSNGGQVTPEVMKRVYERLKQHYLVIAMEQGTIQGDTGMRNAFGLKDFEKCTAEDVMELLAYQDIPRLRKDNNLVSAMLDDNDLPLQEEPTTGEMIKKKLHMKISEKLFGNEQNGREAIPTEEE